MLEDLDEASAAPLLCRLRFMSSDSTLCFGEACPAPPSQAEEAAAAAAAGGLDAGPFPTALAPFCGQRL